MKPLVVIGAAGFGRETLNVVDAVNRDHATWGPVGVLDDSPTAENLDRLCRRGIEYLGSTDDWLSVASSRADEWRGASYTIGIGNPIVRRRIAERFDAAGSNAATLIHPMSTCGALTTISSGCTVCAGAHVSTSVALGKHVHVNPGVVIGHDAELDDFVSLNPGAVISGAVHIISGSLIGASATVLQGLEIAADTVVGAGAVVTRPFAPGSVLVGVPARPLRESTKD